MDPTVPRKLEVYVDQQRAYINACRANRYPRALVIGIAIGILGMFSPVVSYAIFGGYVGGVAVPPAFIGALFVLSAAFTLIVLLDAAGYGLNYWLLRRAEARLAEYRGE